MSKDGVNRLRGRSQFSLFVISYLPLFILLIVKQLTMNSDYMNIAGISVVTLENMLSKFGLSIVLVVVSFWGIMGACLTLLNIEKASDNGFKILIKDIKNKNSESIGYIATYIVPFAFLNLDKWYDSFAILFFLIIIYRLYVNSSLVLINPLLSFFYTIYEMEYVENGSIRSGIIISRDKYLQEEDRIKIYEIGHKMYYSKIV